MLKYKGKNSTTQPSTTDAPRASTDLRSKARSLLSLADGYAAAGKMDLAREKYQAVIAQFPNTPEAATAKAKLAGN
jgi:TolA-binding protein